MTIRLWASAVSLLLTLGAGCTDSIDLGIETKEADAVPQAAVEGVVDELPDGKGAQSNVLCVNTDGAVTGDFWLYAANGNGPRENWTQWYSKNPVVVGDASEEQCGPLNFLAEPGDSLVINGSWRNGAMQLVWDGGSGPVDAIKEIWINDRFYSVGEECQYQVNNHGGYNIACTLR